MTYCQLIDIIYIRYFFHPLCPNFTKPTWILRDCTFSRYCYLLSTFNIGSYAIQHNLAGRELRYMRPQVQIPAKTKILGDFFHLSKHWWMELPNTYVVLVLDLIQTLNNLQVKLSQRKYFRWIKSYIEGTIKIKWLKNLMLCVT